MRLKRLFAAMLVLGSISPVSAVALPHSVLALKGNDDLRIFRRGKTITLSFRNDSAAVMELRAGEKLLTLEPGKTATLVLPLGMEVAYDKATSKHKAGDLVVTVARYYDQTTIALR